MLTKLKDNLRRAQSQHAEAAARLDTVMKQVAKGGGPENAGRVQAASLEYRVAVAAVKKAAWQLAEVEQKSAAGSDSVASEKEARHSTG